jgi:hypothetical protein
MYKICLPITLMGALCALSLCLGCASNQPVQKSNLSYGTVKKNIIKGTTNQSDIVSLLGSPNLVTKNRSGDEVWTYTRQSYDSNSGAWGGGVILFGGGEAFSNTAASSFDLVLTFDEKDVVKDYSVVSSQY